ncbi:MAG TPA: hypothetical protein PJ986_06495 [Gammaproteobacteria bacterium]|nr:hypothetical protein [Gammaproteobacteria bacterium]
MLSLLLQWVLAMGGLAIDTFGVGSRAIDIGTDWQAVELREPLTTKTGNPRLLLYLRDLDALGIARKQMVEAVPRVLPPGSIAAIAYDKAGSRYPLAHTGYSFFRGMPGLVLERDDVPRGTTFFRLELRAARPLEDVVVIWLDSLGGARPDG